MNIVRPLRRLLDGGAGVAFAVLLPRAASLLTQWVLALSAGPQAVATFVNVTSHGSVVVSLVAAGLVPNLVRRPSVFVSPGSRALVAGAVATLALAVFVATAAYKLVTDHDISVVAATAAFGIAALFSSVGSAAWTHWQNRGRYLWVLGVLLCISPVGSLLAAVNGRPILACLATGFAGATPVLLMLRPTRIARAARYSLILLRRAIPLSLSNFSTALVFPTALTAGTVVIGARQVGQQALFWSCVAALSISSQSFAVRAVASSAASDTPSRALRAWLKMLPLHGLALTLAYGAFALKIPSLPWMGSAHDAMRSTLLVSGLAPIFTDPLSMLFSGKSRRTFAIGSLASSACVLACLTAFPDAFIRRFGVIGPSAIVGVMRLLFIVDPAARRLALAGVAMFGAGYAAALFL